MKTSTFLLLILISDTIKVMSLWKIFNNTILFKSSSIRIANLDLKSKTCNMY